jgi:hypothetical protein
MHLSNLQVHLFDIRNAVRHLDAEEGKLAAGGGGAAAASGHAAGPVFTFAGHR